MSPNNLNLLRELKNSHGDVWTRRRALARAITLAESTTAADQAQASLLLQNVAGSRSKICPEDETFRVGLAGAPGAGKSTLLLQTLCLLAQAHDALYVTGEESLQQVAMRARRLGLPTEQLKMLSATDVDAVVAGADKVQPKIMVVDSIQVMHHGDVQSAPGSVSQVRECAAYLTRFAKRSGTVLILVGHVTKDGQIAGPRVLEHMVDAVLYFEGDRGHQFRILRAVKNRFGATDEIGVFQMGDKGLEEVANPSALFMGDRDNTVSGAAVLAGAVRPRGRPGVPAAAGAAGAADPAPRRPVQAAGDGRAAGPPVQGLRVPLQQHDGGDGPHRSLRGPG